MIVDDTSITINSTADLYNKFQNWQKNKEENKEENKDNKISKILELYRKYEIKEIDTFYDSLVQEAREESALGKITDKLRKQAEKEIKAIYPNEFEKMKNKIYISFDNSPELERILEEIIDKRQKELNQLEEKIEQIKLLFELTETYEQKIEILKKYQVLNKEGIFNETIR